MDPNATLEELRDLADDVLRKLWTDMGPSDTDIELLASAVQNLDGWIRNGGFLPTDWEQK